MAREIITVDRDLIRSTQIAWVWNVRGQDVGETTSGMNLTVFNAFPRWEGRLGLHLNHSQIGRWRAVLFALAGRANTIRLPMLDPAIIDRDGLAGAYARTGIPFSGGQGFSNGLGFEFVPFAIATQDAAAGDQSLSLDLSPTPGATIQPGQIISHDDLPMGVNSVLSVSGTVHRVGISPAVRAPVAAGDIVMLEARGLFELVSDTSGMPEYGRNHRAMPEISFREVLTV